MSSLLGACGFNPHSEASKVTHCSGVKVGCLCKTDEIMLIDEQQEGPYQCKPKPERIWPAQANTLCICVCGTPPQKEICHITWHLLCSSTWLKHTILKKKCSVHTVSLHFRNSVSNVEEVRGIPLM